MKTIPFIVLMSPKTPWIAVHNHHSRVFRIDPCIILELDMAAMNQTVRSQEGEVITVTTEYAHAAGRRCECQAERSVAWNTVERADPKQKVRQVSWLYVPCAKHLEMKAQMDRNPNLTKLSEANGLLAFTDEELEAELKRRRDERGSG